MQAPSSSGSGGGGGGPNEGGGVSLKDVIDLAEKLRQERLLISNERGSFHQLNDALSQSSNTVNELGWICAQHRQNLNNLVMARPDTGLRKSCQKADVLENTRFVDAYKADGVKYEHVLAYVNLFTYCYSNSYQLAQLLAIGDLLAVQPNGQSAAQITPDHIAAVSRTVATGLYGNAMNAKDTHNMLQLLKHLIEIQIVTHENPRRMLRMGSCAFARFYHDLHESLFSAKMFLTAVLNDPVTRVLIDDELALELDPDKAFMNFTPAERQKRFGSGRSDDGDFQEKVKQYLFATTNGLHKFVTKFIQSLRSSWGLFPATLRWLVKTMCNKLKRANFSEQMIYETLTDMVLINFICPAIVSPEIYGITDCPISENARFNLITIGQILQQMALLKYQSGDRKFQELFKKFERNEVPGLLLNLVEFAASDIMPSSSASVDGEDDIIPRPGEVQRSNVLVAQADLNLFVDYIRIVLGNDELIVSGECRRKLGDILGQLPHELENLLMSPTSNGQQQVGEREVVHDKKQSMINLGKHTKQKIARLTSSASTETPPPPRPVDPEIVLVIRVNVNQPTYELLSEEEVLRITLGPSSNSTHNVDEDDNSEEHAVKTMGSREKNSVAVGELSDILSEQNVVELQRQQHGDHGVENPELTILKSDRTKHFAMINDDVSIGNTSDNLEAVSEAHSNHSVASSLELEENDQNDNLSDMVSANVSGRGSPNISGRDTPSSQVTENNDTHRPPPLPAAKMLNKARSDIEDKFCKFEIKKMMAGDETISIMSDTWSTDVLASDSETLDAGSERDRQFSTPLIPASVILPGDNDFVATLGNGTLGHGGRAGGRPTTYDISETQSESAWSMDVLASDSEKLAEIDTDDNQSIAAKSDITDASSAPDAASYRDGNNNSHMVNNNIPDSPCFAPRAASLGSSTRRNSNQNNPDSPAFNTKQHGIGESVFFGHHRRSTNDESPSSAAGGDRDEGGRGTAGVRRAGTEISRNSSFQSDSGGGGGNQQHMGGVSALTNPFLTPHRNSHGGGGVGSGIGGGGGGGSSSERNKKFYSARQQSSESNQSSTFDGDMKSESFDSWKADNRRANNAGVSQVHKRGGKGNKFPEDHNNSGNSHHHHHRGGGGSGKHVHPSRSSNGSYQGGSGGGNNNSSGSSKKGEKVIKTSTNLTNPFVEAASTALNRGGNFDQVVDLLLSDGPVEHRVSSADQRSASFDGRRNGMMEITSSSSSSMVRKSSSKSASYENHEIIKRHSDKRTSSSGNGSSTTTTQSSSTSTTVIYRENGSQIGNLLDLRTEEEEQQEEEETLVQKAMAMSLLEKAGEEQPYRNGLNLPNGTVTKAGKFTGAIPKSISFDATADKRHSQPKHHYQQAHHHYRQQHSVEHDGRGGSAGGGGGSNGNRPTQQQHTGFINKLRQGLKGGRKGNKYHSNKGSGTIHDAWEGGSASFSHNNGGEGHSAEVGRGDVGNLIDIDDAETTAAQAAAAAAYQETSEDILAKYRRKVSTASSEANASDSTSGSRASSSFKSKNSSDSDYRLSHNGDLMHLNVPITSDDLFHFNNTKRKLRTVLSSADVHTSDFRQNSRNTFEFPLLEYLKIQLAQALNLNDLQQLAYVQEAIRCLRQMSQNQRQTLVSNMFSDMQLRHKYLKYLMRLKQSLLASLKSVERYEERLKRNREMSNRHLIDCCVRLFLEKRETLVDDLQRQFAELTVGDEKIALLEETIDTLMVELAKAGLSAWQLKDARIGVERILLQKLYKQVMFPNDDADILRDQVLREHIKKLAKVITPEHVKLSIPQEYLIEAPWPFAQQRILQISAYKTAVEKVRCVAHCITSIMNLLSISSGRTPSADDLTPVLIYVLIKANPPYLLSTIQYVNCFMGDKLEGQEQYYWTQFCAAVQFIKTMLDYGD